MVNVLIVEWYEDQISERLGVATIHVKAMRRQLSQNESS